MAYMFPIVEKTSTALITAFQCVTFACLWADVKVTTSGKLQGCISYKKKLEYLSYWLFSNSNVEE